MDEAFTVNPPHSLAGRQQGFNRVNLDWEAPAFNSGNLSYFDLESSTDGIGTAMGNITMEIAVMFPAEQMDLYRNASLKSVSFTPLSDCDQWKLCLYNTTASGALREIYSQQITQRIKTGEANNIILDTPYVCDGKALIVGIQAYSKEPNVRLFGFQEGNASRATATFSATSTAPTFLSIHSTTYPNRSTPPRCRSAGRSAPT